MKIRPVIPACHASMRFPEMILFATFCLFFLTATTAKGQTAWRIELMDKRDSPFKIEQAEKFLSARSIERRKRQGIAIDSTDLPISPRYVELIEHCGTKMLATSKWNNTLVVMTQSDSLPSELEEMAFVKSIKKVYEHPDTLPLDNELLPVEKTLKKPFGMERERSHYGCTRQQLHSTFTDSLHQKGFRGQGMMIAVLDGGFRNIDNIPCLQQVNIAGKRDFTRFSPAGSLRHHVLEHGLSVLSIMAVNEKKVFIGSAPEATYLIAKTEIPECEAMIEEDLWIAGVEWADSIGTDIINSSLGYTLYDDSTTHYSLSDLDGNTSLQSRTASMLSRKGIVLVSSAGNEGNNEWQRISFPADATDIISVGAIDDMGEIANFSSCGPTADQRIKPEVVAVGSPTWAVNSSGRIIELYGTSFSAPLLCGGVACLWQARPELTAQQIIELVMTSADRHDYPDNHYGHGTPNLIKAYGTKFITP